MEKAKRSLFFVAIVGFLAVCGSVWAADGSGPIAHWKFDDGAGTIAEDSAGDNDGTLVGNPTWVAGEIGDYALDFDGVGDYVDLGEGPAITGTEPFAVSVWVKTDSGADSSIVTQRSPTSANGSYGFGIVNGKPQFHVYNNGLGFLLQGNVTINDGLWHHIAAVRTSSTDAEIYVDGILAGEDSGRAKSLNSVSVWIGGAPPGLYFIDGSIDDVRIYNRALSAEEVREIYSPAQGGLIAHWKFDEDSGTIAEDSAGDNDGTLVNGPTWTTGQIDGALSFDGVDDYVDCGNSFASVTGSTTKTIMAWAKPNVTDTERIINLYRRSDSYTGFSIFPYGNPPTWQGLYATPGNNHAFLDSGVLVTASAWTHIALVQDGVNVNLYINGVLEASATDGAAPVISSPPDASIGAYVYRSEPLGSFDGLIDDVRIYDRALSAEEILLLSGGELGDLVGLEIVGQEEVDESSSAQYTAIASYSDGSTEDVTGLTIWSVEPDTYASIDDNGLLTTESVDNPEDITIYAQYTEEEITVGSEMAVRILDSCPSPRVPRNPDPCDGAIDVMIDTSLIWNGGCSESCDLSNGGFESGVFDPWTTVTGPGRELIPWNVSSGDGKWGHGFPLEGAFFAQNGFDGEAGLFYDIYQEVAIPACASSAVLNWSERIQWDMYRYGATVPREYVISVQPAGGGADLAELYTMSLEPGTEGDTGYVSHSVDLLSEAPGIAGQTVRINFHEEIPESFTGPAQFDLDGISLNCNGSTPVDGVGAAESSLSALGYPQGGAIDFEAFKAEYEQFRAAVLAGAIDFAIDDIVVTGESEPASYDVYIGTEDPPGELIASDLDEPVCSPGKLKCGTRYYWQVVAKNLCGQTEGPVWSFTTISAADLANLRIEEAVAEKEDMLGVIDGMLGKEREACEALDELLESRDYGDLKKSDIVTAKHKIHSAMRNEEQSKAALKKSIENLYDALGALIE